MKRLFRLLVLLAAVALVAVVYRGWFKGAGSDGESSRPTSAKSQPLTQGVPPASAKPTSLIPPLAERNRMSLGDHLRWLEEHGEVPQDADLFEWRLAQKASWYGQPLDPKVFWHNRVVWLNEAAQAAAKRHGRLYPPPPYEDAGMPQYGADGSPAPFSKQGGGGPDGAGLDYKWTSAERAFWDHFARTHPRPPEDLDREQRVIAEMVIGRRRAAPGQSPGASIPISPELLASSDQSVKARAIGRNYPPEAFSEEALLWSYVLGRRQELEMGPPQLLESNGAAAAKLLRDVPVDSNLITKPLTAQQVQAANAWKIAYLHRLRLEKTDESYITAYLQAWNLNAAEVFGGTSGR
jgi:hypothetical protein